jgi:hypothetical protein
MTRSFRTGGALVLSLGIALALPGCTYYVAPGAYSPYPAPTYERAWSAALGALEDQGVQIVNVDRAAGSIRGMRGGINVTALVRSQSDASVQIEFKTSGNTDADPTLIDRVTRSYNARMGR